MRLVNKLYPGLFVLVDLAILTDFVMDICQRIKEKRAQKVAEKVNRSPNETTTEASEDE